MEKLFDSSPEKPDAKIIEATGTDGRTAVKSVGINMDDKGLFQAMNSYRIDMIKPAELNACKIKKTLHHKGIKGFWILEQAKRFESDFGQKRLVSCPGKNQELYGQPIAQHGQCQNIAAMRNVVSETNSDNAKTDKNSSANRKLTEVQQNRNEGIGGFDSRWESNRNLPDGLDLVVTAWPNLSDEIKVGIVAMVKAMAPTQAKKTTFPGNSQTNLDHCIP